MLCFKNGPCSNRDLISEAIGFDIARFIELCGYDAFRVSFERSRRARGRVNQAEKLILTQVALKVRQRRFQEASRLPVQAELALRAKVRKPRVVGAHDRAA